MAEELDERTAFDYFWDSVTRIQTDQHFREVLREIGQGKNDTLGQLVSDPAAFLTHRGIQIPKDFRVSVRRNFRDSSASHAGGGGQGYIIVCDCIEVCFLNYCTIFCYCDVFE
jgi:hypothetical protein